MAFNPTKTREWKDGTTPATGTLALGSLFNAEFDQLYENDNFLKAYFPTDDRLTIDEIEDKSGNGVKFLDPIGLNIDPVTNMHLHQLDSTENYLHFTNTTTGATSRDGLDVGIDASENAIIRNRENTDLELYTNNAEKVRINSAYVGIRFANDFRLYSVDNSKYGSITHNNTNLYITTSSGNIYTDKSFGIGVAPSNLLHIQGTGIQFRIAYDGSNYITAQVNASGNLFMESTGGLIGITGGNNLRVYSSDEGEYGNFIHNGSNFLISTGGTSAGNIVISNTTESTSKDTGALIVEGGVGVEKNLSVGGSYTLPLKVTDTTESTTKDTGCTILEGGIGIEKNCYVGGALNVNQSGELYNNIIKSELNSATVQQALQISTDDASPTGSVGILTLDFTSASPDDNTRWFLKCEDSTTQRLFIYSDGDVYNHDGTYGTISDEKLKENIRNTDDVLEKVLKLKIKDFNLKDKKDKIQTGMISQEVEKIFPDFVKEINYNDNIYKGLAYSKFIPILIKAIQEQQKIIEKLKK